MFGQTYVYCGFPFQTTIKFILQFFSFLVSKIFFRNDRLVLVIPAVIRLLFPKCISRNICSILQGKHYLNKTSSTITLFISVTLKMLLSLDINLRSKHLLNLNWRSFLRVNIQTMFGKLAKWYSSSSFEETLLIFTSVKCSHFFTHARWADFRWLYINRVFYQFKLINIRWWRKL